jgi:uncharacterized repeat protein (TIGR02543 family)
MVLEAQFEKVYDEQPENKYYTVEFKVDGTVYYVQNILENTIFEFPANPTKEGYEFIGWYHNGSLVSEPMVVVSDMTFEAGFEEVKQVIPDEVTLQYTGTTTTNMNGENQAELFGLNATMFSVVGSKGLQNNNVGLNADGSRHTADPIFKEENYPKGIGNMKNIVFENITLWRMEKVWKEEVLDKQGECSLTVVEPWGLNTNRYFLRRTYLPQI